MTINKKNIYPVPYSIDLQCWIKSWALGTAAQEPLTDYQRALEIKWKVI